ncbi:chloramphenicol phosphotransferase CPT [Lentzea sp.]|uniref:chloramphenicol phosphotransferase CPT n=1 Tax=Lentzea sp. TaxID=56099 RepID=UPI002CFE75D4|nr:chloramphenicol phosphotransferase CPT [Lentzea sp.]HUQ61641.1 chloramphenicol phosphotransferase CPT [Lentzea sp.]
MSSTAQVIVLNGGSSSGKSGIVRCLQALLPEAWLAIGVDTLIDVMPARLQLGSEGIGYADDGEVTIGAEFRLLEDAWMAGVAAMVRAGARVIVDDVFLGGTESRQRWAKALDGLDVVWVGVRCAAAVAAGRELARGDRVVGMAEVQADLVHRGMTYDVEVDTEVAEAVECAKVIVESVRERGSGGRLAGSSATD